MAPENLTREDFLAALGPVSAPGPLQGQVENEVVCDRTLLADCLQEMSLALDYATSLPEADPGAWAS